MDQAVAMALENNLDLKSNRFNLVFQSQGVAAARAAFLPLLTAGINRNTTQSVPLNQFETTANKSTSSSIAGSTRYAQTLPWHGANYNVWSANRGDQQPPISTAIGSGLTVQFNQPLWQRFGIDSNRFNLDNAQRNVQIADLNLQAQVLATQDSVRLAYLNLTSSIASLQVAQEIKRVNVVALANARARIAVGNAADIDGIQSEAAVLSSEEAVINAEAAIYFCRRPASPAPADSRPDYWQVHIVPTDQMEVKTAHHRPHVAIKNALANRLIRRLAPPTRADTTVSAARGTRRTRPSIFRPPTAPGHAGTAR
jgi:outer membrane protein TolC